MAASTPPEPLHVVFLFAADCGPCKGFKANVLADMTGYLKSRGVSYSEYTADSKDVGFGASVSPKVLRHFKQWWPCIMITTRRVFERADAIPATSFYKSIHLFNGTINERGDMAGNRTYGVYGEEAYKSFINKYLNSKEYKFATGAIPPRASSAPAPQAPVPAPVRPAPASAPTPADMAELRASDLIVTSPSSAASSSAASSSAASSCSGRGKVNRTTRYYY